jgi:hypothetical protein
LDLLRLLLALGSAGDLLDSSPTPPPPISTRPPQEVALAFLSAARRGA